MTPAVEAVRRAGVAHRVHEYEHDPSVEDFGAEAVQALGLDPARVFKTLVALGDDRPVVAVVPVGRMLDLKALARAAGAKRSTMADPADAERWAGAVRGGISPVGMKRRLPTFVDESAGAFETVFVSGGRRGLELELAPADLVALTGATLAPLARD